MALKEDLENQLKKVDTEIKKADERKKELLEKRKKLLSEIEFQELRDQAEKNKKLTAVIEETFGAMDDQTVEKVCRILESQAPASVDAGQV